MAKKNEAKDARASGKEYVSQWTGRLQNAKKIKVSKTLWYIINLQNVIIQYNNTDFIFHISK